MTSGAPSDQFHTSSSRWASGGAREVGTPGEVRADPAAEMLQVGSFQSFNKAQIKSLQKE